MYNSNANLPIFQRPNGIVTAWGFSDYNVDPSVSGSNGYVIISTGGGGDQVIEIGEPSCVYQSSSPGTWSAGVAIQPKMLGGTVRPANPGALPDDQLNSPANPVSLVNLGGCPVAADPIPNTKCGNPIDAATGNKFQAETDYASSPHTHIGLTRYYNSQDFSSSAFGTNWHSSWHAKLRNYGGSPTTVVVTRADGRRDSFTQASGSTLWTADPDVTSVLAQVPASGPQTGWALTSADDSVQNYTLDGTLSSVSTRAGLTTSLTYNASNQLIQVTGPFGHTLTFAYDTNGRINQMTVPDGGIYLYAYDSNNNLTSVTYPDNTVRQYKYENATYASALTGIVDEDGNRFATWSYDSQLRAISSQHAGGADLTTITYNADGSSTVTDADGNAHSFALTTLFSDSVKPTGVTGAPTPSAGGSAFTYDSNGFVASVTDFDGNITTYAHDARGDQTSRTEAWGTSIARTITTAWLSSFHLPSQIAEPNRTTTFTYDSQGNMLTRTVTTAAGIRKWSWTYNVSGQVLTATEPNSNVTTYSYDAQGDLSSVTDALKRKISITSYNADGYPESITDANGVITLITYDARQRLVSETVQTSASNLTTSYVYDAAGNLTRTTLSDGSFLAFTFDAAHRRTKTTDAFGNSVVYTFDLASNVIKVQIFDASGRLQRTRSYTYDVANRLQTEIGALNQTTTYSYDLQGNRTGVNDPLGHATSYSYDALNRLISTLDANTKTSTYSYDANDNLISVMDPNSNTTSYAYDGFGDVIQEVSPARGTSVYHYDLDGNLVQKVDARSAVANYSYDALNRVTATIYPAAAAENVAYTYDQAAGGFGIGRLTSVTDAAGSLSRTYDERGNILTESRVHGGTTLLTTYTYDVASRVASIIYPSGWTVSYTRDAMGRTTAITIKTPGSGATATTLISGITYQPFGPVNTLTYGNGIAQSRSFDTDYRLTNLTATGLSLVQKLGYGYDVAGNVSSITDGVTSGNSQNLGYDALNRLTGATGGYGSLGYTYDPNGNRLTENPTSTAAPSLDGLGSVSALTYNQSGRLATVSAGNQQLAQYTYDVFGHRTVKIGSVTATTLYQYDLAGHLLEENDGAGTSRVDYVYLNGQPIATIQPTNSKVYFLHDDRLGTPQLATDASQTVQWTANYQPFGYTTAGIGNILQSLRLPGQEYDAETGLYQNGFRDYIPGLGRYMESDPIGLAGGANTFEYVGENPFKYVDSTGKNPQTSSGGSTLADWALANPVLRYVGDHPNPLTDLPWASIYRTCGQFATNLLERLPLTSTGILSPTNSFSPALMSAADQATKSTLSIAPPISPNNGLPSYDEVQQKARQFGSQWGLPSRTLGLPDNP